jgi:hypothetical protein
MLAQVTYERHRCATIRAVMSMRSTQPERPSGEMGLDAAGTTWSPRELAVCGVFGAAALLLPGLFHLVRLGQVFMPMYLPLVVLAFLVRPRAAALTAFGSALQGLGIPDVVSALVQQILHQARVLARETGRIAAAMALRGGIGSWRRSLTILWSFPGVWLPRVMARAGRVGTAMELRGYTGLELVDQDVPRLRRPDLVVMGATLLGVGAAAVLRWGCAR